MWKPKTMKNIQLIVVLLVFTSCSEAVNNESSGEINNSHFPDSVALNFINEYVSFSNNIHFDHDINEWVKNNPNVTDDFKQEAKSFTMASSRDTGLDFDPIFNAQDYPEEGFEIKEVSRSQLYTLCGKEWKEFEIKIQLTQVGDDWFVDGAGALNMSYENTNQKSGIDTSKIKSEICMPMLGNSLSAHDIYQLKPSEKIDDWQNPARGGSVHINLKDEIEIYQKTDLSNNMSMQNIDGEGSGLIFDLSPVPTSIFIEPTEAWKHFSEVDSELDKCILITSEIHPKKSEVFEPLILNLWKNGVTLYYLGSE